MFADMCKFKNHFAKGVNLFEIGKYTDAINELSEAIKLQPGNDELYYNLGLCNYESASYSAAIINFTKAILIKSYDTGYLFARAMAYTALEQLPNALKDMDKLIELNPSNYEAMLLRGMVLFDLEEYELAIEDFLSAIKLDDGSCVAHIKLGYCYMALNINDLAIVNFSKVLEINADDQEAIKGRAAAKMACLDYANALQDFAIAQKNDPNDLEVLFGMGKCHLFLSNFIEAIDCLCRAVTAGGPSPQIYNDLGLAWFHQGDSQQARDYYQKALAIDPGYKPALENLTLLQEFK